MKNHPFMKLLKETEDYLVFSANAYWLSCRRVLQKFTIMLTLIHDFLETKEMLAKYSIIKDQKYGSMIHAKKKK